MVAFLCSKDAEMIRGQVLVVDGGVLPHRLTEALWGLLSRAPRKSLDYLRTSLTLASTSSSSVTTFSSEPGVACLFRTYPSPMRPGERGDAVAEVRVPTRPHPGLQVRLGRRVVLALPREPYQVLLHLVVGVSTEQRPPGRCSTPC